MNKFFQLFLHYSFAVIGGVFFVLYDQLIMSGMGDLHLDLDISATVSIVSCMTNLRLNIFGVRVFR